MNQSTAHHGRSVLTGPIADEWRHVATQLATGNVYDAANDCEFIRERELEGHLVVESTTTQRCSLLCLPEGQSIMRELGLRVGDTGAVLRVGKGKYQWFKDARWDSRHDDRLCIDDTRANVDRLAARNRKLRFVDAADLPAPPVVRTPAPIDVDTQRPDPPEQQTLLPAVVEPAVYRVKVNDDRVTIVFQNADDSLRVITATIDSDEVV